MIEYSVLFVCTGNTCRSPMAEGLAKRLLSEIKGVAVQDLEQAGVRVRSAGIAAGKGGQATPEAVEAAKALGADISGHRSQPLTEDLIQDADAIYTMTEGHRNAVLIFDPKASGKTRRLIPEQDVADPIGGPQSLYSRTAAMIQEALRGRIAERYGDKVQ